MSRRLFLDAAAGETRGVVQLDGRPERLLSARFDDDPMRQPGARVAGRVRLIARGLGSAFIDLGPGVDAVLPLTGAAASLAEGARVSVEIVAPPRRSKGPVARLIGPAEGEPRLLAAAPGLRERLRTFAPEQSPIEGAEARAAADKAEEAALAILHPIPGGGSLTIEPTTALTAIDVDSGAAGGADPRRMVAKLNRLAVAEAARLLRLKGLGGLVVIDLAGRGHDGEALKAAALAAFAPDQPGVGLGPISRFGLFELSLPHRETPVAERLNGPDGRMSAVAAALRLARALEAAATPGAQVEGRCHPTAANAFEPLSALLAARIGPRFTLVSDSALAADAFEVRPR